MSVFGQSVPYTVVSHSKKVMEAEIFAKKVVRHALWVDLSYCFTSNDNMIFYVTPLQVWHCYRFGCRGDTCFAGKRSLLLHSRKKI